MSQIFAQFNNIHVISSECHTPLGSLPRPLCFVGKNITTGTVSKWTYHKPDDPPVYTTDEHDLVVTFNAEFAGQCIISLGWNTPLQCLDLHPMYRCHVNRFGELQQPGLGNALEYLNLHGFATIDSKEIRDLAQRGGEYSTDEMDALVDSSLIKVEGMVQLLRHLLGHIELSQALFMGRYSMTAIPAIQNAGVPVNRDLLLKIVAERESIRGALIAQLDNDFGVYVGGRFSASRLLSVAKRMNINWPRTSSGELRHDKQTIKELSQVFPQLKPLAELKSTLAALGNITPAIGPDSRLRTDLRPFTSITGRNQPSTATDIFSWTKWFRHLIRPRAGRGLLFLDFEQQEFLNAAALSGDPRMLDAYRSGDPYLETAKRASQVPMSATKATHSDTRDLYKTALLAIQYHCTEHGLAPRVGSIAMARRLIQEHHGLYPIYHHWSQQQIDRVMLGSPLTTPLGWAIRKCPNTPATALNPRSIANWSVQAAGSDILRIATVAMVEHGLCVIAPVHDAIVVEFDLDEIDSVKAEAVYHMQLASEIVLGGERCRVAVKEILPSHDIMTHNVPYMFMRVMSLLSTK